jgi:hypothetical protein
MQPARMGALGPRKKSETERKVSKKTKSSNLGRSRQGVAAMIERNSAYLAALMA